ncbi:hypothetical protein VNI00_006730 [Paramarasmius palmivorus]|uniref:Uncharacterized protein n=1 Tax=Paramarasmius palmivorus TaxID=297713 RepID=A0AAW0D8P8_9AGAR
MGPLFLLMLASYLLFFPLSEGLTIDFHDSPVAGQNNTFVWSRTPTDPMEFYVRGRELIDIISGSSGASSPISANGSRSGRGTIYFNHPGLAQVFAFDLNQNELGNATAIRVLSNTDSVGPSVPTNPGSNTTKPLNAGQIAGMLIGVITLTLLMTIGIMKLRQRHKARLQRSVEQGKVTPSTLSINPYPHTITPNIDREKKCALLDGTPPETNNCPVSQLALETDRERRVVHLEDSGWRPVPENSSASVLLLPPRYDAAL